MSDSTRKFHLSLNVSDLERSVSFYRVLFGIEPAKHHADYAKFDLESPPAVFSLIPGHVGPAAGSLNHAGIRLKDSEELVAIQQRLEAAGFTTLREDGVACCYSRQTKFWVRDPDNVLLELYVFHEDLDDDHDHDHAAVSQKMPAQMGGTAVPETPAITWSHRLGEAISLPLPHDTNSTQEILLRGTINDTGIDIPALLREALRILKPGGTVTLHGLAADAPLKGPAPQLPGLASGVKHVPDFSGLELLLHEAGFRNTRYTKLSEKGYFEAEGIPLREVMLTGSKPGFRSSKTDQTVVYLGPLSSVEDDFGTTFLKGVPQDINMHDWLALKKHSGSQFALLQKNVSEIYCATPQGDCGGGACETHEPKPERFMSSTSSKARYIMIGGFLGAGKTTTVGRLAKHLSDQGLKVGLITNDQAGGLVDTKLLRGQGYATEEIAGGCFCCRFNTLVDAAARLNDATKPDVFIAEPVGSCTDLVATVTYPLRRMYGDAFTIAPLAVLVDPVRARRVFGLDEGGTFSSKVAYIFKKQLEEADVIVISKSDLLDESQREQLRTVLAKEFPLAKIVTASPRQETGLEDLFSTLMSGEQARRNPMAVDYEVYAEGEALLGWLNATVSLKSDDEFDANAFLKKLATNVQGRLQVAGAEIAHFKMTFSPDDGIAGELASINLVRSDYIAELGMELDEPTTGGHLIINLRAEADPASLMESVKAALDQVKGSFFGLQAVLEHEEHFRPGKPVPTHRDGELVMEVKGGCKPGSGCC